MKFVEMENLREGMRLARPIYNKKGVLLVDRDSKLTKANIEGVKNFGLLGMYILEPAEPLPPMSQEDLEFERFQIMSGFSIRDELERLQAKRTQVGVPNIASIIIKKYGHLENKINYYQNLRSQDDFISRHSLNVAILCAMITHVMNTKLDEQLATVEAAIVHDVGKQTIPQNIMFAKEISEENAFRIYQAQIEGLGVVEEAFSSNGVAIKRICAQAAKAQEDYMRTGKNSLEGKMVLGAKILLVANRYDEITAMNMQGKAQSEVKAIQEFLDHPEIYDKDVVNALIRSIYILFPGVSVELNTGEKALVLVENTQDILRPTVLSFEDNSVLDLGLAGYRSIYITDIMKTLDNRYIMDTETIESILK